jgi:hypothetical protein
MSAVRKFDLYKSVTKSLYEYVRITHLMDAGLGIHQKDFFNLLDKIETPNKVFVYGVGYYLLNHSSVKNSNKVVLTSTATMLTTVRAWAHPISRLYGRRGIGISSRQAYDRVMKELNMKGKRI